MIGWRYAEIVLCGAERHSREIGSRFRLDQFFLSSIEDFSRSFDPGSSRWTILVSLIACPCLSELFPGLFEPAIGCGEISVGALREELERARVNCRAHLIDFHDLANFATDLINDPVDPDADRNGVIENMRRHKFAPGTFVHGLGTAGSIIVATPIERTGDECESSYCARGNSPASLSGNGAFERLFKGSCARAFSDLGHAFWDVLASGLSCVAACS